MIRTVIALILVGALGSAFITWALVLFAKESTSAEAKVRRTQRFLEMWMFGCLAGFYVLTAQSAKDRKLILLVIGLMIAIWVFRAASRAK